MVLFGGVSKQENNNGHNSTLWAEIGHVSVTTSWTEISNNATLAICKVYVYNDVFSFGFGWDWN